MNGGIVEDDPLIKHGLFRIALAGVLGIVLFEFFEASPLAFLGVFLSLAFGVLLILGRPVVILEDALARLCVDVLTITLVVAGVGTLDSPFTLLYFVAAAGIALIPTPVRAGVGGAVIVCGYLASGLVVGASSLLGPGGFVRLVLLGVFCGALRALSGEIQREKAKRREAVDALSVERGYSEGVSTLVTSFGSVLGVLDLRSILGWTVESARDLSGAVYAHAVLLDGNQHRTSHGGDSDASPTWWHPEIQELVLHGSRNDGPLHERDKEIHAISGFVAVPLEVAGSEHNGTLVVGGGEFGEREERMLSLLARQAAFALRGSGEAPGGRDVATGLPNRASLYRVLGREMEYDGAVTVVSARVEGLWSYSRSQGLGVGEALLRRIAQRLEERQRVFRYGMNEFVVLMRGESRRRAERTEAWIREVVREISDGSPVSLELSLGHATAHSDDTGATPERVISGSRRASEETSREAESEAPSPGVPEAEESGIVASLLEAATIKDFALNAHLRSVRRLSRLIGVQMGLAKEEIRILSLGALLHDVGKIGVPDSILKKPSSLSDAEFDAVKRHTVMGASVLSQVSELAHVVPIVRHHHERFDGNGYPDGFRGEEIPLGARIVFVADAYDSMVRERPYREGLTHDLALEEIEYNAGTQFDPAVARAFLKIMREADQRRHFSA